MGKVLKFIGSLVAFLVMSQLMCGAVAREYGVNPVWTFAVMLFVVLAFAVRHTSNPSQEGKYDPCYRCDGVDQIFWAKLIIGHLFKNNKFLNYCRREDEYVVGGSAVYIPQVGALPTVIKNNGSWPMTAIQRVDTAIMYALNVYSTTPMFVILADLLNISYDKTSSILQDHFGALVQNMADDQLVNWANGLPGATNTSYTTGPATANLDPGQIGTRNTLQFLDIKALQAKFNKMNIPENDRILLMESNMYDQLTTSLSATAYKDFSREFDAKTGTMGKLFGFDIMTRSSVLQANAALDGSGNLQINPLGQALAATDNLGCLAWQKDNLALALGEKKLFTRVEDPLYQGDVFSTFIKAGGRVRRADNAGVWALLQGTPA